MGWKRALASRVPHDLLDSFHAAYWARHKTDYLRAHAGPSLDLIDPDNDRRDFYRHLCDNFVHEPVTFMEFGVFEGESLIEWAHLLCNPETRILGFDTFEGLPEAWKHWQPGHLSTQGRLPTIGDDRAMLFAGLFQETLNDALAHTQAENQLILHIDSDLHSAALYVLSRMDSRLKTGDLVIFDQWGREHEYRAFQDYINAFRRNLEMVAALNADYAKVAFRVADG